MGEEQFYGHMLSGAIAGTVEHCAMFPLDTIKTRMQMAAGGGGRATTASASSSGTTMYFPHLTLNPIL
jgi:solute carrier family 25 iron transporter 28/37